MIYYIMLISDFKVWDIVEELVLKNMYPTPENPFSIDFTSFQKFSLLDRFTALGSLLGFLRHLLIQNHEDSYNKNRNFGLILNDLAQLSSMYYDDWEKLVNK